MHLCRKLRLLIGPVQALLRTLQILQRADDVELSHQARVQTGCWPAYLHVNMKGVAKLEQGLIRLLAIEARQYCAQIQQRWVKGYFQHETVRRTGDHWTLVVVGDLDGNDLLIMNSMAAACWGECHLQSPVIYNQACQRMSCAAGTGPTQHGCEHRQTW